MKRPYFAILYLLLLICQMVIYSYFQFTPLVTVSILAGMVLCIPLSVGTPLCMFIALLSGLAVDFFSEGIIGLNAASLVPVALARTGILRIYMDKDLIIRKDIFTYKKEGFGKIFTAVLTSQALFLLFYLTLDGAASRSFGLNCIHYFSSLLLSTLLSLLVVNILNGSDR